MNEDTRHLNNYEKMIEDLQFKIGHLSVQLTKEIEKNHRLKNRNLILKNRLMLATGIADPFNEAGE